jgi:hypothetical protein
LLLKKFTDAYSVQSINPVYSYFILKLHARQLWKMAYSSQLLLLLLTLVFLEERPGDSPFTILDKVVAGAYGIDFLLAFSVARMLTALLL